MSYRKFYWTIFPETFISEVPSIVNGACMQKINLGHRKKLELKANVFRRFYFSGLRDFNSGVMILIHSAGACILVMACVDCARACS